MDDRDLDIFTRNNPEAHERYLKAKKRKRRKAHIEKTKRVWSYISKALLWISAVGGFVLGLLNWLGIKA